MNGLARWSIAAYSKLLMLYPADLRNEFGQEMLDMFEDDLSFRGAFQAWRVVWERWFASRSRRGFGFPLLLCQSCLLAWWSLRIRPY